MVRITEQLIRKKAEHNECIISTLEELSLHQEDIERLEKIDTWCRELKILYLQSNLIPKIENVSRLKKLEYLNLALNNIERVENLEGCESLKKLDLTVNFVGEVTSIECLKELPHFQELYLTGNPCVDYEGYRPYVIATLPRLKWLDGVEIEKSERILAIQELHQLRPAILQQQQVYRQKRERQKEESAQEEKKKRQKDDKWYTDINTNRVLEEGNANNPPEEEEDQDKKFWEEKVAFTPESRIKVHEHMQEQRHREENKKPTPVKPERKLQMEDGRYLNVNEAKVDFHFNDDEENNCLILDVAVFKYMDTSLCDVDVQPTYVKVTIKGKLLQLVLPEEVKPDASSAKRSAVTGHLLVTMPKVTQVLSAKQTKQEATVGKATKLKNGQIGVERLEVDPTAASSPNFGNIVGGSAPSRRPLERRVGEAPPAERANSADFVDDPDVPPLV